MTLIKQEHIVFEKCNGKVLGVILDKYHGRDRGFYPGICHF